MAKPSNKRRNKRVVTNRSLYKYKVSKIQQSFEKFIENFNGGVINEY